MKALAIGIIIVFLVLGGYMIVKAHQINLDEEEDREQFIYKFADWIFDVGGNIKSLTGHAISMEWLPDAEDKENKTDTNSSEG